MQTLFSESNEIKLVLVTRIMGNNAWNISKTLFVCLSQSPPFWLQYILICSKFRRKWEMLWVFVYTNTHPGKEKAVTTGILYYIRICNPWPNMNTLCKFCELLQKKKNFFLFFGGEGCKFDERCHRFITSTNMTNFVIPPLTSAISVPPWNHQKTIGFSYDLRGNRNSLIRLIEV